jgi:hypothetical protein
MNEINGDLGKDINFSAEGNKDEVLEEQIQRYMEEDGLSREQAEDAVKLLPQFGGEYLGFQRKEPEGSQTTEEGIESQPEFVARLEALKIAKFEALLTAFENEHSLEDLRAITELDPKDVDKYPHRQAAKQALIPIVEALNFLENETYISEEKYKELQDKYRVLRLAVGSIIGTKVWHEDPPKK